MFVSKGVIRGYGGYLDLGLDLDQLVFVFGLNGSLGYLESDRWSWVFRLRGNEGFGILYSIITM